ncbi:Alpha/Beta hydrolase protein [Aspergillus egyptiacus]|nr:Alpha/Beta hydrolase protein [Aspergillus egyptiacus]
MTISYALSFAGKSALTTTGRSAAYQLTGYLRLSRLPISVIRRKLEDPDISVILYSNRFPLLRNICIPVAIGLCSGYWLCKGPPGTPREPSECDAVILWLHGGAYCFGGPLTVGTSFLRVAELLSSRKISISVFAARYTLAPNAKFPRQQHEALAAYRYLLDQNIPAGKIIIGGDAAGGHLCLSALILNSQHERAKPGGALLLYPWVKLTHRSPSFKSNRHNDLVTKGLLDRCVDAVGGRRLVDQLKLGDFTGPCPISGLKTWRDILPSFTLVNLGTHDVFSHDIRAFIGQVQNDGANVDVIYSDKMPHCWNFWQDALTQNQYLDMHPPTEVPQEVMPGSTELSSWLHRLLLSLNSSAGPPPPPLASGALRSGLTAGTSTDDSTAGPSKTGHSRGRGSMAGPSSGGRSSGPSTGDLSSGGRSPAGLSSGGRSSGEPSSAGPSNAAPFYRQPSRTEMSIPGVAPRDFLHRHYEQPPNAGPPPPGVSYELPIRNLRMKDFQMV